MANKKPLSIPVFFEKVETVENTEDRFSKVKVFLMHTGLNFNDSIFEKSVVEDAIPTLGYIPIVGFIEDNAVGEKDFSDHRYIITKKDGEIYRKYIGSAYGVVLSNEDNNAHFEMRSCDDGEEREFLVADGIIWNMFEDSSDIMNRDLIKGHSMELDTNSVEGYEDDDNIFHFTKFSFRACCILGDDVQPAMSNSTVELQFTMKDFVTDFQRELIDKYNEFSKLMKEGGKNMPKPTTDYAQTLLNQFHEICETVASKENYRDRWGDEYARFSAVDIQGDEVIIVDRADNYNYYSVPYTMNGDKAVLDFDNMKRKKIVYEDYENGVVIKEGAFDYATEIETITTTAFKKVESANTEKKNAETELEKAKTEYEAVKTELDAIKPKYEEYVKAEQEQKEAEIKEAKENMFARFETDLAENEEYISLKEKMADYSVDEIEAKCSLLYTRKHIAENETKNNEPPVTDFAQNNGITVAVMDEPTVESGYVETKYGNIAVNR